MKAELDASFRRLATDEMPRLRRYALAISGDPHRADDLVQGALERLYVVWPRMHRAGDPAAYLRTVLTRLAISESRRPWRRRERTTEDLPEPEAAPDGADRAALRLDLLAALAGLTVKQRAIVVLRYLEDLSVRDVAEQLDISEGTVKRQSSDAVAHLRRRLAAAPASLRAQSADDLRGADDPAPGAEASASSGRGGPAPDETGATATGARRERASVPGVRPDGPGPADPPATRPDRVGVDVTPRRERGSSFDRPTEGAPR